MNRPASEVRWRVHVLDGAAMLVLLALTVLALATFRHYGLGWDDLAHAQMGEKLLALYGSGFENREALFFVNLNMYGGGFDMLAALAAKVLPFPLFEIRRLVGGLVGIAGLAVTWRLGRLLGGPAAGLIALVLLATCAVFYGHMFINAKDAPFAVAMAVLLLALARGIEEYPRPSAVNVLLFGFGLGLLIGTRILGVIAGLFAAAALLYILLLETRALGWRAALARFGRFLLVLSPGLLVGYAVMGLLWPWAVVEPLNPWRAVQYFSVFFEKPWRELFDGRLILVPDMPASYLPTLLGLQLAEIMLILSAVGIAVVAAGLFRTALPLNRRATQLLVLTAALAPIALGIAMRPAMYNGFRHFLFVLPPLAVLGGLGGAWLLQQAARFGRPACAAAGVAMALALVPPIAAMARLHPYQYTYFNSVQGGVRGAEDEYMLDYWGLSFKQAAQQLRAALAARAETPRNGQTWRIAVCGPHSPAEVALGPEFTLTWDPSGADFALMLGTFYCMEFGAPILAEVKRDGVVYARAYDIRQRSYTTLFAPQPP